MMSLSKPLRGVIVIMDSRLAGRGGGDVLLADVSPSAVFNILKAE